jgi:hypothetical protein
MLERLTCEDFAPHLGETFQFTLEQSDPIELTLVEAISRAPRRARRKRGTSSPKLREPFSILFRGPHVPALEQRMYHVEHHKIGVIEGLFIVPVGEDQDGRQYEAVFA